MMHFYSGPPMHILSGVDRLQDERKAFQRFQAIRRAERVCV